MSPPPRSTGPPSAASLGPPSGWRRRTRAGVFLGVLGLMGWGIEPAAGVPGSGSGLAAQTTEAVARARYDRALQDFNALQEQALSVGPREMRLRATIETYRELGNQRALQDLMVNQYIPLADSLTVLNVRSRAAKAALDEARQELLRVFRAAEVALLAELERGPSRAREEVINREIVRIRQETNRLELEREPLIEVGFRPIPNLQAAPTDGPAELRAKAETMERWALRTEGVMAVIDEELKVREDRLRLQQTARDARDGIGRFDGDRPVGTGPTTPPGTGQAADQRAGDAGRVELAFSERPLTEQIQLLLSLRMQAEEDRTEALERAVEFRRLAQLRGGGGG
jgi:hypothetical protein